MKKIDVYDTTLRDGTQAEEINLSLEDKIRIALKLDELGLDYIEGGWPGSNPVDRAFFAQIANYDLGHSRITAFGSTHNPRTEPESDENLQALAESGAHAVCIFGKTWDLHVTEALRTTRERNLEIIAGSVAWLKRSFAEVIFDAEHFFDGFKADPDFAMACLKAAFEAGADVLVPCDTNGGTLPQETADIFAQVGAGLPGARLGIHAHNDSDTAVANTLAAVNRGATHVQGTMNGFGERCGNANLCSIIPNLELKMGFSCLPPGNLVRLTETANYITEVANLRPFLRQPYTGRAAFAHKGGIHVSAIMKNSRTYEHVPPESVGNMQRVLVSDLSGRANVLYKIEKFRDSGLKLDKDSPELLDLVSQIKDLESQGYEFSAAEASFDLLFLRKMGLYPKYFDLLTFRVMDSKNSLDAPPFSEATVMLEVQGNVVHTAATGKGPVNALDSALRKALENTYPRMLEMRLADFKVRVLSGYQRDTGGTASVVRVLIESSDREDRWTTVGVSYNLIDASWQAMVDAVNFKLFKDDPGFPFLVRTHATPVSSASGS
jgi:2-isopropylmalate synthase